MDHIRESAWADDLHVGDSYRLGEYQVSEDELIRFARQWDPQLFHTDRVVAGEGYFGGVIGSGIHTIAICQRLVVLSVYSRWNVIAGRRFREVEFLSPLRPNDVLTGALTVEGVVLDNRSRGLVTAAAEVVTSEGVRILTMVTEMYVRANTSSAVIDGHGIGARGADAPLASGEAVQ
ncbi:MaoC/PaaZ C-terminal domain-containing protein [Nocardia sp. NPDC005366]|uniref:MaoC/PaaZ C-terminal domain-containing protein n=1 Tax=Nocardia sp. NPDC005366 TaxID=3156878 RepID=UPI0033AE1C01